MTSTEPAGDFATTDLPLAVAEAGGRVRPVLAEVIGELEPATRAVASYHFGWTDEHGRPADGGGGKGLRPALTLVAAQAVGAGPDDALPGAAAVELVHNFSLLHDDVMDGDVTRRQRSTAWRLFGVPAAVLTGDALLALAVDVLDRAGNRQASSCLTAAIQGLISGQGRDVGFERRADVRLDECLAMADGKTAALMSCAARIGPMLAGAAAERADALGNYGRHLGLAFQLIDDLLGIWGDPAVTGKPLRSDLRARKKTVPVVAALNSGTDAGAELGERYHRELDPDDLDREGFQHEGRAPDEEELAAMASLIERSGALDWTRAEADRHVRLARGCLADAGAKAPIHQALDQLAGFITERDR